MDQDRYTIGKLFPKTGCLSQASLIGYAEGTLSPAELRSVELHIADCPLCEEALDGILMAGTSEFTAMADELGERVDAQLETETEGGRVIEFRPNINPPMAQRDDMTRPAARTGFRKLFPIMSIAAGLALVATLGIFYMNRVTPADIADEHFIAMEGGSRKGKKVAESPTTPDTAAAVVMTPEMLAAEAYEKGMHLYINKDYAGAVTQFDKDYSSKAKLYAGDCYYLMGKYDLAAYRYKSIIEAANGWEEHAEYNLALAYLKMGEVAQARKILEGIKAKPDHDFNRAAIGTLEEVLGL
ncbi:MAG: tetratricopeptide repeat protein [Bacteroidia bacterium]